MTATILHHEYDRLKREATILAGALTELSQRATLYRQIFLESRGNHAFPIIAAHGALWAGGYFRFGMRLGSVLSWQYAWQPELRRRQLQKLDEFADVFRDINRRVCIDTYVNFHFTKQYGDHPEAIMYVDAELLEPLNRIHAAVRGDREMTETEKQIVFEAHFRHEQDHIVGPALTQAAAEFDWPLMRTIALRPIVTFSYFPQRTWLWFRNFASKAERIKQGLTAFEIASDVGWRGVDAALKTYDVLPDGYFAEPMAYFHEFRNAILGPSWERSV
ncbi:MAG: hypothetical protein O2955_20760 [Planctomycetota bacterium]|nr:hypothetical protein [Planctomycetota bacterium]MDA1214942.1 hypothetical protein [Planctomycetota bacterium]